MAVKWAKWKLCLPTSFISRRSKIYPHWDFLFENVPSGNPDGELVVDALIVAQCLQDL
jgi:hypothetical protein